MRSAWVMLAALAACDGKSGECKALPDGGAAPAGATITVGATTFRYGGFIWGENHDCTPTGSAVLSVTIRGSQVEPAATAGIGLCLPRPDAIGTTPISLADTTLVQLVGVSGLAGGCLVAPSFSAVPTGTVTFAGFCTTAGTSFLVTFAGSIPGTRNCADAGAGDNVSLVLAGTALVAPQPE